MSERVVDRLEVVEVEHQQSDRIPVAFDLFDLDREQLLEARVVTQTGELVGYGLTAHLVVQIDILEGEGGLCRQQPQQFALLVRERPTVTTDRDQPV